MSDAQEALMQLFHGWEYFEGWGADSSWRKVNRFWYRRPVYPWGLPSCLTNGEMSSQMKALLYSPQFNISGEWWTLNLPAEHIEDITPGLLHEYADILTARVIGGSQPQQPTGVMFDPPGPNPSPIYLEAISEKQWFEDLVEAIRKIQSKV